MKNMVLRKIFTRTMMEMKKKGEALNKHKFRKSDSCRVMYKLWKFCCKNAVLISFFVFRFILEDTEGKEDTKMEMMKKMSMRRMKKT